MDPVMKELVNEYAANEGLTHLKADVLFESFAAHCVLNSLVHGNFRADDHRTGGSGDLGIDAWGILINGTLYSNPDEVTELLSSKAYSIDVTVVVVQAKTSSNFTSSVLSELADNLHSLCEKQKTPYEASDEIKRFQSALHTIFRRADWNFENSPKLEVRYVTSGFKVNDHLEDKCRSAEERINKLNRFQGVRFSCVTVGDLEELFRKSHRKVSTQFVWERHSTLPPIPGVPATYIGSVPAHVLVDKIVCDDKGNLRYFIFDENLREFLGTDAEVNKGIVDTLKDAEARKKFAILNNGITIVTSHARPNGDMFAMRNFQVVNGSQTAHLLAMHRNLLDEDDTRVKLTVVQSDNDEIISSLVKSTNQQTHINTASLGANDPIQRNIEIFFSKSSSDRTLRYKRKQGVETNHDDVRKSRILDMKTLARAYMAVFIDAHKASHQSPLRILDTSGDQLFRHNHSPAAYYAAASTWFQVEWLLRNGRVDDRWKPARYLLMAGLRYLITGNEKLPPAAKLAQRYSQKVVDTVWNPVEVEEAVNSLVPLLEETYAPHKGKSISDVVRTKDFCDDFLRRCAMAAR